MRLNAARWRGAWPLVAGLVLLGTVPAGADCSDDPTNLMAQVNCDFDTDLSGWKLTAGDPFHQPADGSPEVGSLESTNVETMGVISSCFEGEPDVDYRYEMRLRILQGDVALCQFVLWESPGPDCVALVPRTYISVSGWHPEWIRGAEAFTSLSTTGSMQILGGCSYGEELFSIRVDDFVVARESIPVELTGFTVE